MSINAANATRHEIDVFLGKTEKCRKCSADIPLLCADSLFGLCKNCRPYISAEAFEAWLDEQRNEQEEMLP